MRKSLYLSIFLGLTTLGFAGLSAKLYDTILVNSNQKYNNEKIMRNQFDRVCVQRNELTKENIGLNIRLINEKIEYNNLSQKYLELREDSMDLELKLDYLKKRYERVFRENFTNFNLVLKLESMLLDCQYGRHEKFEKPVITPDIPESIEEDYKVFPETATKF